MNKIRLILIIIIFLNSKLNAENYVDNISGISNLAENTVKAAVSQMDVDTNKVKISKLPKLPKGKKLKSVEVIINITD